VTMVGPARQRAWQKRTPEGSMDAPTQSTLLWEK
jgi:hypothetical protein